MSRPFFGIPPILIGGTAFALGAVLSLASRGATLTGNALLGFSNSHPASQLARISMVVGNVIKIPGYYSLFLGVPCTVLGTSILLRAAIDKTRYSESRFGTATAWALGLIAGLGALWVGLPNNIRCV